MPVEVKFNLMKKSVTQNFKKGPSLNLGKLDDDFEIPLNWKKMRTMGQGAYGKVMECLH